MNFSLGQRKRPSARRCSESRRVEWLSPLNPDGWPTRIFVTIGYRDDAITPCEIFYDSGYKTGSDMETLLTDICVVLSVLIQHEGVKLDEFMSSISREINLRTDQVEMGSIVGVLLQELRKPPQWIADLPAPQSEAGSL
jgi:hypothetical protein